MTTRQTGPVGDWEWMRLGSCVTEGASGDVFFPPDRGEEPRPARDVDRWSPSRAIAICHRCPVRLTCLDYALTNRIDDGVWGGHTPKERRVILKQRLRNTR